MSDIELAGDVWGFECGVEVDVYVMLSVIKSGSEWMRCWVLTHMRS